MTVGLTLDMVREAIRSLGAPVPDFVVSCFIEKPIEYQATLYVSPDDARQIHAKTPLILRQKLSATSGRYCIATPFDGPFPLEPEFPPYAIDA